MVFAQQHKQARHGALPHPGAAVAVRMSRGRLATRLGRVLDVRDERGPVIAVRWDDDGSVSCLVPGADLQVTLS